MTFFADTQSSNALIFHNLHDDSGQTFSPGGDKQKKKKKENCKEYSFQRSECARIHARIKVKEKGPLAAVFRRWLGL